MKEASKDPNKALPESEQNQPAPVDSTPPIPKVPLTARSVNPEAEIVKRNMLDAVLTLDEPAQGAFSAVASRRWGELSNALSLGTSRPARVHMGLDDDKLFLFLAPTSKEDARGLEVRYAKQRVHFNLIPAFAPLSRYVQPGRREYYRVGITPEPVQFDDGFKSLSLYVYLKPFKTEPRRTMSEESKAKLRATLAKKKLEQDARRTVAAAENQ